MMQKHAAALAAGVIAYGFLAAAMTPALAQGADPRTPALQQLIEAAKAEGGTLDMMNASLAEPAFIKDVSEGMSRRYGFRFRLNVIPGPTPSALAPQLVEEYKAKRPASTDIFAGDDVNSMVQLEADALHKVDWKALSPTLPDEAVGPQGGFLRFASRIIGCVWYNTKLVAPNEVPKELKDVLVPKWKGRVASTNFLAGFREAAGLFGQEQQMADFLKAFENTGNLAGFIRGAAVERIISGEFAMMVVAPGEYPVLRAKKEGAPVEYTILRELPYVSFWTLSVPKNSAHPNLAKLFAVYMLSREGQDAHFKTQFFDLHYLEGSQTAQQFKRVFQNRTLEVVTNEILTSKWSDYERVMPVLAQSLRGR